MDILITILAFVAGIALLFSWGFFFLVGMNYQIQRRQQMETELENRALQDSLQDMADYYGIDGEMG